MSYTLRINLTFFAIGISGVIILNISGFNLLAMPFLILFALIVFFLPRFFGRPRYKANRDNPTIPAKYKNYQDELFALGFELDCVLVVTYFFLPTNHWVYRNHQEHVEAYINEAKGLLWFSSYFEKNFDVSTRFREGPVHDNKKLVSHIVKTSIADAFDYHLQHRQKYLNQYGSIILFESAEQQIEWESQQNLPKELRKEEGKGCLKQVGRFVLSLVILFGLFLAFAFIIIAFFLFTGSTQEVCTSFLYALGNGLYGSWIFRSSFLVSLA